jgi:hypothetical protein
VARIRANKADLLVVLDRPEIPLHTNGSERDIRCCVTKRKISGETRADAGKQARDTFLSLLKTCSKLAVSFWDYLGARLTRRAAQQISRTPTPSPGFPISSGTGPSRRTSPRSRYPLARDF